MESNNSDDIHDNLPTVEPDNDEVDQPITDFYARPILVVSIFAFGIAVFICTVCAICNAIFQYFKEKLNAEREARAERRDRRFIRDSYSPLRRHFLPNTSAKRVGPRAPNRPPANSIDSSASYRRNFLRGLSIDSNNSLLQYGRSSGEQRSFQSGFNQSTESDNSLQQYQPSASYTRCFLRRYGINTESDNRSQQSESRETSFEELRSFQRSIQGIVSDNSQQQNEPSATYELRSFQRTYDQSVDIYNTSQQNESSATYSNQRQNFQKRYGINTESDNGSQQSESKETSFEELRSFQRSIQGIVSDNSQQNEPSATYELRSFQRINDQSVDIYNASQQNESSATYSNQRQNFQKRFDQSVEPDNYQDRTESGAITDDLRSFLSMFAQSNMDNASQPNESSATSSYELRSFQRRLGESIELDNSRQQNESRSTSSDELPIHERAIDVALANNVTRRTRFISEDVNSSASKPEDTTVKRHSVP